MSTLLKSFAGYRSVQRRFASAARRGVERRFSAPEFVVSVGWSPPHTAAALAVRGLAEALRSALAPNGVGVVIVYPPDADRPQDRAEKRLRPAAAARIAARVKVRAADAVASALLRGMRRNRSVIAPGWEITVLAALHGFLTPIPNRFWFVPRIAREPRNPSASDSSYEVERC